MNEDVRVEAFDLESGVSVGVFSSINKAARKLYIRSTGTICNSLIGTHTHTFKGNKKGIKSYKDGKKYTFMILS